MRRSQEQLAAVLNSIEAIVYVADIKTCEVLFVNNYAEKLFGSCVGKVCWKVFQDNQSGPCDFCTNEKLLDREGKPCKAYRWEFQNTRNGRWLSIVDKAIPWPDGRFVRLEIATDITDRKKLEQTHESILKLYQIMESSSIDEVMAFALEEGVRLTNSKIGYFHFVHSDQKKISLQKWTGDTMKECSVAESDVHYPISQAGVWVDCFYEKKPVVHNDYEGLSHKKGLPQGHVPILRDLGVPVFEQNKIVAIIGVGNKPVNYDEKDIALLALLADNTWSIIRHKRAEEKTKGLLQEKELLLKEVHHRIKNNMSTIISLLKLQSIELDHPQAIEALKSARNRIRSMMVLYDKLYRAENFHRASLRDYLDTLVDEILQNFPDFHRVKVEKNLEDFDLDVKKISPLGIMINEILTNAMKYAFDAREEGKIYISSSLKDNLASVVLWDNGKGLDKSIDFDDSCGLGLKLIKMLSEQLGGTVQLDRQEGTKYTLEFKV